MPKYINSVPPASFYLGMDTKHGQEKLPLNLLHCIAILIPRREQQSAQFEISKGG